VKTIAAPSFAEQDATAAWSKRVRRIGGFIQVAFAAFWLVRGSLTIHGPARVGVLLASVIVTVAVVVIGLRSTGGGIASRPTSPKGRRLERTVTIATIVQLVASFAAPVIVTAAGHADWQLPSIAMTIGPLLLWLDHRFDIPRNRPAGWLLIVGPLALVALASGTALAATTGLAAGALLLAIAALGFRDLARLVRPIPLP
jgi:hypothetical protein